MHIATAFAQETLEAANQQWRAIADQMRPKLPRLAGLMDHAEPDVLAYMAFVKEHRTKSTAPTPSNVSMARSSAAPMSSESSPTRPQSPASSVPSSWSRATNGPSSAPAT